jgi:hypothetical protein
VETVEYKKYFYRLGCYGQDKIRPCGDIVCCTPVFHLTPSISANFHHVPSTHRLPKYVLGPFTVPSNHTYINACCRFYDRVACREVRDELQRMLEWRWAVDALSVVRKQARFNKMPWAPRNTEKLGLHLFVKELGTSNLHAPRLVTDSMRVLMVEYKFWKRLINDVVDDHDTSCYFATYLELKALLSLSSCSWNYSYIPRSSFLQILLL